MDHTLIALLTVGALVGTNIVSFLFGRGFGRDAEREQLRAARIAMSREVHLFANAHAQGARELAKATAPRIPVVRRYLSCMSCRLFSQCQMPHPYPAPSCHTDAGKAS